MPPPAEPQQPFGRALPAVLFCTLIFFVGFMARIVLGPLMSAVQADLSIGHAEAGRLFLYLSTGISAALLSSSVLAGRFTHRTLIGVSGLVLGSGLLAVGAGRTVWELKAALVVVGAGAGLYLPSGIATITSLVQSRNWGRALAVHELAPNLSFILAPLLAEAVLRHDDWRMALTLLGLIQLSISVLFLVRFDHGRFSGDVPSPAVVRRIIDDRRFWLLAMCFALAVGATFGPFTMLPLALPAERGFSRPEANTLIAAARVSGVFMAFVSGWLVDRLGARWTIIGYLVACGTLTLSLGLVSDTLVGAAVVLQMGVSVCFFPAGFAAISRVFEPRVRNIAISLITPFAALLGAGLAPSIIGWCGEMGRFGLGFALWGGLLLAGALVVGRTLARTEADSAGESAVAPETPGSPALDTRGPDS